MVVVRKLALLWILALNGEVWDAAETLVAPASSIHIVITATCLHLRSAECLPKMMATEVQSTRPPEKMPNTASFAAAQSLSSQCQRSCR